MTKDEMETLRMFVLDTLLARTGKELSPDVIKDILGELMERVSDLMN